MTEEEIQEKLEEYQCPRAWVELLQENPDYDAWEPNSPRMNPENPHAPSIYPTWTRFCQEFRLGRYSPTCRDRFGGEVIHWYFTIDLEQRDCAVCGTTGLNPLTRVLYESWHTWKDDLCQQEVDALIKTGGLRELTDSQVDGVLVRRALIPAEEVNAAIRENTVWLTAAERDLCVEVRAKRFAVWGVCPECSGHGRCAIYPATLQLHLWVINPKTGQDYGVVIQHVEEDEIRRIRYFLRSANLRFNMFFSARKNPNLVLSEELGWTSESSVLANGEGRSSPIVFESWDQMRAPVGDDDKPLSPDSPKYATTPPGWELDRMNELAWFYFARTEEGLTLYLWMMHPRKTATRRITVSRITKEDLPKVQAWLTEALEYCNLRFANLRF